MNRTELRQKMRRDNLATVRARYRTNAALSEALGEGFSPSFVSQLLGGHRGIGDDVADKIEARLNLEPGYLDRPPHHEIGYDSLSLSEEERVLVDAWKFLLSEERSGELARIQHMAQRNRAVMEELRPYKTISVNHRREKKLILPTLPGQSPKRGDHEDQ